jgi:hypothetical protein
VSSVSEVLGSRFSKALRRRDVLGRGRGVIQEGTSIPYPPQPGQVLVHILLCLVVTSPDYLHTLIIITRTYGVIQIMTIQVQPRSRAMGIRNVSTRQIAVLLKLSRNNRNNLLLV